MKLLRELVHTVGDRRFILREFNGKRKSQLEDLEDQALALAKQLDEAKDDLEKRKAMRAEKKKVDFDTYRLFMIPLEPSEQTPDDWFDNEFSEGYFMHVIAPLQGALNRHQDAEALGKSIDARLKGETQPQAGPSDQSVGPIFVAR